jgi:hypothetical protein
MLARRDDTDRGRPPRGAPPSTRDGLTETEECGFQSVARSRANGEQALRPERGATARLSASLARRHPNPRCATSDGDKNLQRVSKMMRLKNMSPRQKLEARGCRNTTSFKNLSPSRPNENGASPRASKKCPHQENGTTASKKFNQRSER